MDWIDKLKFRHLRLFLALYESGNLSQTAQAMALSQPAVSKWLQEFESDLGAPLFTRHARGLTATPFARLLAGRARLLIHELDRTQSEVAHFKRGETGPLRVGSTPVAMTNPLPQSLIAFRDMWPKAQVVIETGHLDLLLPKLEEGRIDMVLTVLEDRELHPDIAMTPLYKESLRLVAHPDHPLVHTKRPKWKAALKYPWIGPPSDSLLYRELQKELAVAGLPMPTFSAHVDSSLLLACLLQQVEALGLMGSRSARFYQGLGLLIEINVPAQRTLMVGALYRRRPAGMENPLVMDWIAALMGQV